MPQSDDELRKLLEETTPGDWYIKELNDSMIGGLRIYSNAQTKSSYSDLTWDTEITTVDCCCCGTGGIERYQDAALLVIAPDLAAEVLRLRARVAELLMDFNRQVERTDEQRNAYEARVAELEAKLDRAIIPDGFDMFALPRETP